MANLAIDCPLSAITSWMLYSTYKGEWLRSCFVAMAWPRTLVAVADDIGSS